MRQIALLSALLAAAPVLAAGALQDENPAVSDLGKTLTQYATIARDDGSFRRFWVDEASLKAMSAEALPDGAMIAMETFYGPQKPATIFIKQRQDGKWLYGSFEPGKPDWSGMKGKTVCHACHMDAKADLTFTLPTLASFAASRKPLRFECPRPGREPCEDAVYHGATAP
jgi:hypothetical protein